MICPICGERILQDILVRHLPNFYRCPNCSGYYNRQPQSAPVYETKYFSEEQSNFFGNWITKILDSFLFFYKRKVRKLIGLKNNAWVLDYGCGKGKFLGFLKKQGFNIEGYEPSDSAVALAKKNGWPVYRQLPNRKYDLMMFWHSLEHTDFPLKDLEKLESHLNPGAKLLIAVPNGDSLEAYLGEKKWFCYDWPFHRVHFNELSLRKMLDKVGFKIIAVDYWNLNYTIASLAQTFLNFIFPKNLLYSMVSNRRAEYSGAKLFLGSIGSILVLLLFSKLFAVIFIVLALTRKTGTMIVTAERTV